MLARNICKAWSLLPITKSEARFFAKFASKNGGAPVASKSATGFDPKRKVETEMAMKFYLAWKRVSRTKVVFPPEEAEEHFRIGREYNRQTRIKKNLDGKDLATKIWLQQEALAAVPKQEIAKMEGVVLPPPPHDRLRHLYDTPPIKGFDIEKYMNKSTTSLLEDEV